MSWPSIAILKLNSLIKREDFIQIACVEAKLIEVKFKAKSCAIDDSGRVIWL